MHTHCKHGVLLSQHCECCSPNSVVTYGTCRHGVHGGCLKCVAERANGGSSEYYNLPKNPSHEQGYCDTLQDVIFNRGMTWNQANIFKAAYRWDIKPDKEYNLRKIIWFAQDELDRLYAEMRKDNGPQPSSRKENY